MRSFNQVFYDNLERLDGVGDGREVQYGGDIRMSMVDMLISGKNQHNIVKQSSFN